MVAQLEADAHDDRAFGAGDHRHPDPGVRRRRSSISAKTLTKGVGRALALGDFANDEVARAVLTDLAESHADTDTGAASALVMANSLARSFTDYRTDATRKAAPKEAAHFLDLAVRGRTAERAVELAVTVASPTEKDAPVVADTVARIRKNQPKARRGERQGEGRRRCRARGGRADRRELRPPAGALSRRTETCREWSSTFHTDTSLPIDECLVIVVTLEAGSEARPGSAPGSTSSKGISPSRSRARPGTAGRCAWPWPVDSMPRWVDLAPGRRVAGAVPLLATDTSAPLFPAAGAYTLVASFDAAPGTTVASAPVMVSRTLAASPERAAALDERAVLQSLLAAAVFAEATSGLEALFAASRVATRVLAGLALDRAAEVIAERDFERRRREPGRQRRPRRGGGGGGGRVGPARRRVRCGSAPSRRRTAPRTRRFGSCLVACDPSLKPPQARRR